MDFAATVPDPERYILGPYTIRVREFGRDCSEVPWGAEQGR